MSDQLWVVGVVLVIVGSLGNNLGTNLISYDHKKKEITENNIQSQKEQNVVDINDIRNNNANPQAIQVDKFESLLPDGDVEKLDITVLSSSSSFSSNKPLSTLDEENSSNHANSAGGTSSRKDENIAKTEKLSAYCSLRNVGLFIFVTGNLLTFAAFGFAAQSLLAALESVQFVSNIAFAKYIHKEIITFRMVVATVSIIIGNVLVVIFASHQSDLLTSGQMLNLYLTNTAYHCYLGLAFGIWLLFHMIFTKYYNARVIEKKFLPRQEFVEPFAFSVSSAIIGTQAVLQAKCLSILIQVTTRGDNEFVKPTIWVILVAWIFFVVFWLKRLDLGLKLYAPLFIIPVLQVFFVFFAILCGGIYFQEFIDFGPGQWVGFLAGVGLILGGVYGLAPTKTTIVDKVENELYPDSLNVNPSTIKYEENPFLTLNHTIERRLSVRVSGEPMTNVSFGGQSNPNLSEQRSRSSNSILGVNSSGTNSGRNSRSDKSPVTRSLQNSTQTSTQSFMVNRMQQL